VGRHYEDDAKPATVGGTVEWKVKSETGGIVEGLGHFESGEERVFGEEDVVRFAAHRGVALNDASVPEGFSVTIVTEA